MDNNALISNENNFIFYPTEDGAVSIVQFPISPIQYHCFTGSKKSAGYRGDMNDERCKV